MNRCYFIKLSVLIALLFALSYGKASSQNVMEILHDDNRTSHFAEALEEINLDERLGQPGPFTLFVPSSGAFNGLSNWQKSNDDLLLNHIFMGMATERSLRVMSNVTFLSGKTITIEKNADGEVIINSYPLEEKNIKASNGVIHIIDGVIK